MLQSLTKVPFNLLYIKQYHIVYDHDYLKASIYYPVFINWSYIYMILQISSTASANPLDVEDYLDCFEEMSNILLEYVVNMTDMSVSVMQFCVLRLILYKGPLLFYCIWHLFCYGNTEVVILKVA
jgi:hypothetical protein